MEGQDLVGAAGRPHFVAIGAWYRRVRARQDKTSSTRVRYGESKTYYHTIVELQTLRGSARTQRRRVGGTVAEGSIRRLSGRVDFALEGEGKTLPVSCIGSDPLPATFVDKCQALVQ